MLGLEVVIKIGGKQVIGREGEGGEGEGEVPGGVYREMRSPWAEESISKVREVKVEATIMGLEGDGSMEIG